MTVASPLVTHVLLAHPQALASPTATKRQNLSDNAVPGISLALCQQHEEPTVEETGLLCQPGSLQFTEHPILLHIPVPMPL